MQSPFEAVKTMSSIFRTFSQLERNGNKCASLLWARRNGQHKLQRNFHGGRTCESRKKSDFISNHSYICQAREGSLFAFASSSSLIWPGSSGNGLVCLQQNSVDEARIKEVGSDRACAEWLLRCGAGVKWDNGPDEWLRDYNSLPVGSYRTLKIVEIDATDSAVMHIGFLHFRGLKNVRKAIFHRCGYMEDDAIRQIGYLKDTLEDLQISSCGNVTDEGINTLVQMKKLKKLKLYDFLEVRDRKKCIATLEASLPNCVIDFPFVRESDRDPPSAQQDSQKT